MDPVLTPAEQELLLRLARAALEAAVAGQPAPVVAAADLPATLRRPAAAFVTLTQAGDLRGCIGGLEAHWPLYEDVCRHAAAAATQDYRFPPLTAAEAPVVRVEISVLTEPRPLNYAGPADLLARLRPGLDGVTLAHGRRRATFLPQVWAKIPDPEQFLDLLCEKMGLPADTWRRHPLEVSTYQVEEFAEPD